MNVGCHVEGSHGDFVPSVCNPDGSQATRRKRARLQGTILEVKGEKRWLVRFDNGLEKECPSVTLKMLGDPRYNRASASVASAPMSSAHDPSAQVASAFNPSAPTASAPIALAPLASDRNALAPLALAPVTLAASAPVGLASDALVPVTLAHEDATATPEGAPIPAATALTPLIPAGTIPPDQAAAEDPMEESEEEDLDLMEADDEIEQEDDEDAGFDVAENITADVHQQRRNECELKKQELIESNWRIMTRSSNVELEWNIVPDSIPEYSVEEFESLGIRTMDWTQFCELCNMAKSGRMKDRMPQPFFICFFCSGLETGRSNWHK